MYARGVIWISLALVTITCGQVTNSHDPGHHHDEPGTVDVKLPLTGSTDHSHESPNKCPAPRIINTCTNASQCELNLLLMENKQSLLESRFMALQAMYEAMKSSQAACNLEAQRPIIVTNESVSLPDGEYAKDCTELYKYGVRSSGVHYIKPTGVAEPFPVFCELGYEGWTLLMRRFDGSVSFVRSWADYKRGFGTVKLEHYLGNERIHQLTSQPGRRYKLRVDMTFWVSGLSYYAEYKTFKVDNETTQYQLTVSGYSGNVGFDGMSHHSGHKFSTYDQDNDITPYVNCAASFRGGWWYSECHHANPTGVHQLRCNHDCIEWRHEPIKKISFKVMAV